MCKITTIKLMSKKIISYNKIHQRTNKLQTTVLPNNISQVSSCSLMYPYMEQEKKEILGGEHFEESKGQTHIQRKMQ